jgi:hypothetical protein
MKVLVFLIPHTTYIFITWKKAVLRGIIINGYH